MIDSSDVSDSGESTLEDLMIFLRSLKTHDFMYQDVLECYAELVGKSWTIDEGVKRGPRIPTRSEVSHQSVSIWKRETSDGDISDIEDPEAMSQIHTSTAQKKTTPIKWTKEETDALVIGIKKYGWGKWRTILDNEKILRENKQYRQIISRAKYLKLSGGLKKLGVDLEC